MMVFYHTLCWQMRAYLPEGEKKEQWQNSQRSYRPRNLNKVTCTYKKVFQAPIFQKRAIKLIGGLSAKTDGAGFGNFDAMESKMRKTI
jgi:hypothetical protein